MSDSLVVNIDPRGRVTVIEPEVVHVGSGLKDWRTTENPYFSAYLNAEQEIRKLEVCILAARSEVVKLFGKENSWAWDMPLDYVIRELADTGSELQRELNGNGLRERMEKVAKALEVAPRLGSSSDEPQGS